MDLTEDGSKAVARVVSDLAAALSRPFMIGETARQVRVSIGVALHTRDGNTAAELLAAADSAMYQDKPGRRGPDRPATSVHSQ